LDVTTASTVNPWRWRYHQDQLQDDLAVQICTSGGLIVYFENVNPAQTVIPIDISKQAEGIYFLTVLSGRHVLYRQKMIKH